MTKKLDNNENGNGNGNTTIYSPKKVAEILEVKVSFVKRLLREETLKGFKMGKFWRITEDALNAYIIGCRDKNNGKRTVDVETKNKIRFYASIRSEDSLPKSVKEATHHVSSLKDELANQTGAKKLATIARLKSAVALREELKQKKAELPERQTKLAQMAYEDLLGLVNDDPDAIEDILLAGIQNQGKKVVDFMAKPAVAKQNKGGNNNLPAAAEINA